MKAQLLQELRGDWDNDDADKRRIAALESRCQIRDELKDDPRQWIDFFALSNELVANPDITAFVSRWGLRLIGPLKDLFVIDDIPNFITAAVEECTREVDDENGGGVICWVLD
jgi:hypothetical protein